MKNKLIVFTLGAVGAAVFVFGGRAQALGIYGSATGGLNAGGNASVGVNAGLQATTSAQSSLEAEIQAGTVATSAASENAIVNLEGNADSLIHTDTDLAAYGDLVIKTRPAVTSINEGSDGSLSIGYSQPAKFFGIFPASLSGEVIVDAQGNASISLPWWAVFYTKDTASVQSSVAAAVQQSGASFNGNASADASGSLQEKAKVINAVTAALESQAEAGASANAGTQ